jgi:hypothetical protein
MRPEHHVRAALQYRDLLGGGSGLPAQVGLRGWEAAVLAAAAAGDVTVTRSPTTTSRARYSFDRPPGPGPGRYCWLAAWATAKNQPPAVRDAAARSWKPRYTAGTRACGCDL